MATFAERLVGAARLDVAVYEEVEADENATGQALAVVLLSSIAGGIGAVGLGGGGGLVVGTVASLIGWVAWAAMTYIIGTRLLPEPQTAANIGQLLRTIGFAGAPGIFHVLRVLPYFRRPIYLVVSVWLIVAMVIAVRQALDYRSTFRAVGVCLLGWLVSTAIAFLFLLFFDRTVF
jgi:hypothetical protein